MTILPNRLLSTTVSTTILKQTIFLRLPHLESSTSYYLAQTMRFFFLAVTIALTSSMSASVCRQSFQGCTSKSYCCADDPFVPRNTKPAVIKSAMIIPTRVEYQYQPSMCQNSLSIRPRTSPCWSFRHERQADGQFNNRGEVRRT